MSLGSWAMLVAVGCGKASAPPASSAPAVATPAHADAARWLECTETSRAPMERVLLARHHLEKGNAWAEGLKCVTIQLAQQPAFFIELVGSHDDTRHRLHGVVATDATTELIALRETALDWAQLRGGIVSFETIDLDSDGTDEIIVHYGDQRQRAAEWIDVVAIRNGTLVELKGPRISYDDPDLGETCHGILTSEPAGASRHLVVTTTASTGESEHCLGAGRHVFAVEVDRLVELGAR
jgi:hypothetical protein